MRIACVSGDWSSYVNSGFTDGTFITLYRTEENLKVLIHELFHSLCLDFSSVKYEDLRTKMKGIFDVKSEFEISESYSEYWATILNCCFISI